MTAKEYLNQYRLALIKIEHRKKQLAEFKSTLGYSGINLSDKVQTSPKDSLSEGVAKAVDIERSIREDVLKLEELKDRIISEIHQLDNPMYIKILYKRYIEGKKLWEISEESDTKHDYAHLGHLHGYALLAFTAKVLNLRTQTHI